MPRVLALFAMNARRASSSPAHHSSAPPLRGGPGPRGGQERTQILNVGSGRFRISRRAFRPPLPRNGRTANCSVDAAENHDGRPNLAPMRFARARWKRSPAAACAAAPEPPPRLHCENHDATPSEARSELHKAPPRDPLNEAWRQLWVDLPPGNSIRARSRKLDLAADFGKRSRRVGICPPIGR